MSMNICFGLLKVLLQRRRRNHFGEAKRSPLSLDFNQYTRFKGNPGTTVIGRMIRFWSDAKANNLPTDTTFYVVPCVIQ
ncbi:hypothetical protein [Paenibacillus sp. GCM10028914]|uniref:hypothetical protein n=1 Tax=Paenibacillus sp. GCM10028914 TaxID=3273416 RepID=UPI00361EA073